MVLICGPGRGTRPAGGSTDISWPLHFIVLVRCPHSVSLRARLAAVLGMLGPVPSGPLHSACWLPSLDSLGMRVLSHVAHYTPCAGYHFWSRRPPRSRCKTGRRISRAIQVCGPGRGTRPAVGPLGPVHLLTMGFLDPAPGSELRSLPSMLSLEPHADRNLIWYDP